MSIYIIYKTTNLITGKYYIGKHQIKNNNFDDGYLGSGKGLLRAINKHGKENFTRETLHIVSTNEEAAEKEASIVNEVFIKDRKNYNMRVGGDGGAHGNPDIVTGVKKGNIPWNKGKKGSQVAWNKGVPQSEDQKKGHSEKMKGRTPWNKGLAPSDGTKDKISKSLQGRKLSKESIAKRERTRLIRRIAKTYCV